MDTNNSKREVKCSECGAVLSRRPINANTGMPITHFFCDHKCKGEHQKMVRPITKEQAEAMYLRDGMSAVDIGRIVGRHPKGVWNWLKDWGIPTRPRGADGRQHFAKGHKICVGRKHTDATKEKLRQARIADGAKCFFLPNGNHVLKGKRGAEVHSWKGGVTPLRQAFYSSDEWKAACVHVWSRADAKCERCGLDHRFIDRSKAKFHVHHVASFAKHPALRSDPDNLRLLCAPCHRWVHGKLNFNNDFIRRDK